MAGLADLFVPGPATWGMRGDPHLWTHMLQRFAGHPLPPSEAALEAVVFAVFLEIVGSGWNGDAAILVPALRQDWGGMSNGHVAPRWWRETALPLLKARWREAQRSA